LCAVRGEQLLAILEAHGLLAGAEWPYHSRLTFP
jgi:hypothetical protein